MIRQAKHIVLEDDMRLRTAPKITDHLGASPSHSSYCTIHAVERVAIGAVEEVREVDKATVVQHQQTNAISFVLCFS